MSGPIRTLLLAAGVSAGLAATACAEQLAPGLDYVELGASAGWTRFVRVSVDKFEVRILTPESVAPVAQESAPADPERSPRGLFLDDYRRRYQALVVMTGGYIASFSPPKPVGLVKSDHHVSSPVHNSWQLDGVVCVDNKRFMIDVRKAADELKEYRDCLQAGPLLLKGGKPPTTGARSSSNYAEFARKPVEQAVVCIDGSGAALLLITEKISLDRLIAVLQLPAVGCVDALRVNSGPLLVKEKTFGSDEYLFPNAFGVIPRSP